MKIGHWADSEIPANENYAVWLSKQDVATQNKVFGIEKSKIYRVKKKLHSHILKKTVKIFILFLF